MLGEAEPRVNPVDRGRCARRLDGPVGGGRARGDPERFCWADPAHVTAETADDDEGPPLGAVVASAGQGVRRSPSGSVAFSRGDRTAATQVTVAEISAAPSMWKPTSTLGQVGEVLDEADRALGQLDRRAARATRASASAVPPAAWTANSRPTVRPTNRNTASAWSWLTCSGSRPLRGDVDVAGVRAGAGDHGADVQHQPAGGEGRPSARATAAPVAGAGAGWSIRRRKQHRQPDDRQRAEQVERDDPRVEVGQHGDAADDRLGRDAQREDRAPGAAGRGGRSARRRRTSPPRSRPART